MKHWLAVMAMGLTVPATVHASDMASARAFAVAWNDTGTLREGTRAALDEKLQRCVKAGFLTEAQVAAGRTRFDAYLSAFADGLGAVDEAVATKAAAIFTSAELRSIAAELTTPAFRRMRKSQIGSLTNAIVPRIPGCGDQSNPLKPEELGAQIFARLSPSEKAKFAQFALSPVGRHFGRAMPALMDTLLQAFREDVEHALLAVGIPPAAAETVRTLPSPIAIDPPKPGQDTP